MKNTKKHLLLLAALLGSSFFTTACHHMDHRHMHHDKPGMRGKMDDHWNSVSHMKRKMWRHDSGDRRW